MGEIAICDHFKWTLDYLRNMSIKDYMGVVSYLRKMEAENKKAMRKAKRRR